MIFLPQTDTLIYLFSTIFLLEKIKNRAEIFIFLLRFKQAIYNIEVGKRTIVDFELCAFAKCFGISVNNLTDEYFDKLK